MCSKPAMMNKFSIRLGSYSSVPTCDVLLKYVCAKNVVSFTQVNAFKCPYRLIM